jgi:hypothetical protein
MINRLSLLFVFCTLAYVAGCSPSDGYYYDDDDDTSDDDDDDDTTPPPPQPPPPQPPPEDEGCSSSDECSGMEFCHNEECEPVLDRRYRITIQEGEASTNGPWDFGGGAPDIYIRFGLRDSSNDNWTDSCSTATVQNAFDPAWYESCELVFASGSTLAIWAYEDDAFDPDWIGGVYWQGNDALVAVVRLSNIDRSVDLGDYLTVGFRIEPTF